MSSKMTMSLFCLLALIVSGSLWNEYVTAQESSAADADATAFRKNQIAAGRVHRCGCCLLNFFYPNSCQNSLFWQLLKTNYPNASS